MNKKKQGSNSSRCNKRSGLAMLEKQLKCIIVVLLKKHRERFLTNFFHRKLIFPLQKNELWYIERHFGEQNAVTYVPQVRLISLSLRRKWRHRRHFSSLSDVRDQSVALHLKSLLSSNATKTFEEQIFFFRERSHTFNAPAHTQATMLTVNGEKLCWETKCRLGAQWRANKPKSISLSPFLPLPSPPLSLSNNEPH